MVIARNFAIVFLIALFSCKAPDNSQLMQENLTNEINNRLTVLAGLAKNDAQLGLLVSDLHRKTEDLIMLSRDHENPMASVTSANSYYRLMAKAVTNEPMEPMMLYPNMTPTQIQLTIKQNELWLLNNLIFLKDGKGIRLFSVVEKTLNWH